MTIRRATYVQDAYAAIRSAIIEGRLPPRHKVIVRPLAEELGLSPTPIKGALAALEREGFLIAVPHRGYFVPDVSTTDMNEIYELREVLDGIAARRSATGKAHTELAIQLKGLLARQHECVARGDLAGYSDLDVTFHQAILAASGNARLSQVADNLLGQLRLGRIASTQVPGQVARSLTGHAEIIAAIAAGDGNAAENAGRHHVHSAGAALNAYRRLRPPSPAIRNSPNSPRKTSS
jgi:DNA-binding GntR family transcriptional regulator